MEQEVKNKIWNSLDLLRGKYPLGTNIKLLELIGETQGLGELDEIFGNVELTQRILESYSLVAPKYLLNFITKLSKQLKPNSILDPWLTLSSPALQLSQKNVTGICHNNQELEDIKTIFEDCPVLIPGFPVSNIANLASKYDLVLSFPPISMKGIHIPGNKTPTYFTTELIIACEKVLSENGVMILLMSPSFLTDKKGQELIEKSGMFVDGFFAIPTGTFAPFTNISSNLVIFSKQKKDNTFIAEISKNEDTNNAIFENYINRKQSKVLQLGTLVNIKEMKSFHGLVSQNELEQLVKRIGYGATLLSDIAVSINQLKQDNPDEVEHLSNSFYFPRIGNSPVVATPSAMKIKPKHYFQIQLDDTKANAIFVANYFNTPVGLISITGIQAATIPQTTKSSLMGCGLYLPDLTTQSELLKVDSKIEQFTLQLDALKRNLWKKPLDFSKVSKELKSINHEKSLEQWIDTLPFPLSSIIWRYYATKENAKKIEHLLHFFEAFSEFLSMIMLSALSQDKEFYRQECHKWIDSDIKFKDWYLRASFGSWNVLTAKLSKVTREYLFDDGKKDFCKSIYGNSTDEFLNMITSKGIVNVLVQIASYRNQWKGHGGISSEEENKQRVITLEQHLNEFRKYIADGFEETKMLSPTTSSFEDGVFTYSAKELIGARTPFNEITFQSLIPLDRKKLYLFHTNQNKPLELLPFIKYIEASDAIYFYTSIESKDVRWVSYHFDKESEIKQPADNELFKAFNFLKSEEPQG